MTDIDRVSGEIAVWAAHNWADETRVSVVLGLAEETGEVCRAALKQYQGIRGTTEEWDAEIRKEAGDVFIKLAHVAEVFGFSLDRAISTRWADIRQRDFVRDPIGHGLPKDGVPV